MSDEREQAIESALSILDYGCDYGDYHKEAAAVRALLAENVQLRDQVRRLWWQCREQGCMAKDEWAAR